MKNFRVHYCKYCKRWFKARIEWDAGRESRVYCPECRIWASTSTPAMTEEEAEQQVAQLTEEDVCKNKTQERVVPHRVALNG